jgi:hypothetical protein
LDHGEARDDLVEVEDGLEVEGAAGSKDLDPDRGVDQDHEVRFFELRSLRIAPRSPLLGARIA